MNKHWFPVWWDRTVSPFHKEMSSAQQLFLRLTEPYTQGSKAQQGFQQAEWKSSMTRMCSCSPASGRHHIRQPIEPSLAKSFQSLSLSLTYWREAGSGLWSSHPPQCTPGILYRLLCGFSSEKGQPCEKTHISDYHCTTNVVFSSFIYVIVWI